MVEKHSCKYLHGCFLLYPNIKKGYCFENEENSNLYSFTDDIPVGIYPGFSINIAELLK